MVAVMTDCVYLAEKASSRTPLKAICHSCCQRHTFGTADSLRLGYHASLKQKQMFVLYLDMY